MQQLSAFIAENWFLSGLALVLLVALFYLEFRDRGFSSHSLPPQQATMMMNRKTMLIIDLRDPNQYDAGHILNAKSFTLAALQLECDKLTRNKDKPILIYGSRQSEVARAVTMLKAKGFTEVYHLSGGITAWQKDNLPLVKSATLEVNHG